MKRLLSLGLSLIMLGMSGQLVEAVNATAAARHQEMVEQRQAAVAEHQETMEQKREELQEQRQEQVEQRCEQIGARINNRLNQYQNNKDRHQQRYLRVKSRVEDLVSKLEDKDCDVSEVRADLITMEVLLTDLASSWRVFHDELYTTHDYVCGDSEGEYKTQLQAAQSGLTQVRKAAQALQDFVQGELKSDLNDLKTSCQLD